MHKLDTLATFGQLVIQFSKLIINRYLQTASNDRLFPARSGPYNCLLHKDLFGGINVIHKDRMIAIPDYAWSNRGVNKMKVWLNVERRLLYYKGYKSVGPGLILTSRAPCFMTLSESSPEYSPKSFLVHKSRTIQVP